MTLTKATRILNEWNAVFIGVQLDILGKKMCPADSTLFSGGLKICEELQLGLPYACDPR